MRQDNPLYFKVEDYIDRRPYDVAIPDGYRNIPVHDPDVMKYFGDLFMPNVGHTFLTPSKVTIRKMIDLYTSQIEFEIINDIDVLDIMHYLNAYFEKTYDKREIPEYKVYYAIAMPYYNWIRSRATIVLNKHPDWKKSYAGIDTPIMEEIWKLLNRNIENMDPLNPYDAHRKSLDLRPLSEKLNDLTNSDGSGYSGSAKR